MARPRKYFNERKQTGITIDAKILNAAIEAGIPISQTCENALLRALHPALLTQRLEAQRAEITTTLNEAAEREKAAQKEKEAAMLDFNRITPRIYVTGQGNIGDWDMPVLHFWSKKLGLSIEDLKALKRGEIDNQQHVSD